MKEKLITFEKEGQKIEINFCYCEECNVECKCKGATGSSSYDEYWYYMYQCPKCKNIEIFDGVFERESRENLLKLGWTEIK